jgi:hypothetical protein
MLNSIPNLKFKIVYGNRKEQRLYNSSLLLLNESKKVSVISRF